MASSKIFKKTYVYVFIFIASIIFAYNFVHNNISAEQAEKPLKQSEFIINLVKTMQLESQLPKNPTINDYVKVLESQNITLPGGYKPDENITTKQMAIMLAPIMGMDKTKFNEIKREIREGYKGKAVIIDIKGNVEYKKDDGKEWKTAKTGLSLSEKDTIKTGVDSKLILRVGEFGVVTIKSDTILVLYNLVKAPSLYIEKGELLLDTRTHEIEKKTTYYVITPTTVTAVRGTILRVSIADNVPSQMCIKGIIYVYEYIQKFTKADILEKIYAGTLDEAIKENWVEIANGYNYEKGQLTKVAEDKLREVENQTQESSNIENTDYNEAVADQYSRKIK
jgi:hypothetical protein